MRIIFSSWALRNILKNFFTLNYNITLWKLTPTGIAFFDNNRKNWIILPAELGRSSNIINVAIEFVEKEIPFHAEQWRKIAQVLIEYIPHQPVTLIFANTAKEVLLGDTTISIQGAILNFKQ